MSSDVTRLGREFLNSVNAFCGHSAEWLEKLPEDTSPDYGTIPTARPLPQHISYGVVNIDKPPGPTSHEVTAWVKRILGVKRAGHGGTLDPKVTGVLPIALENMTKIMGSVVHSRKVYICVMQLHGDVSEDRLREVVKEFTGLIYQRPPVRSNVKRALRVRNIYSMELLEARGRLALLRVESDPGTYMRKLCWDMGLVLGIGAHMRELRRVKTGPFDEDHGLVTLQQLSEAVYRFKVEGKCDYLRNVVMPGEFAVCELPKVVLRDSAVESVVNGALLAVPGISLLTSDVKAGSQVAMMTLKGELVGLGEAAMGADEIMRSEKGIAVKPKRIVMPRGVYPRMWKSGKA